MTVSNTNYQWQAPQLPVTGISYRRYGMINFTSDRLLSMHVPYIGFTTDVFVELAVAKVVLDS
jgi:hypothetical protein